MRLALRRLHSVLPPVVAVLATACSSPELPAQTVTYYRTHADERRHVMRQCADDPGRLGTQAACINAREAERLESLGSLRDLPPLGLGDSTDR